MGGSALPYHLRPHKAVDRRLFVDLLVRLERWRPLDKHVYLSMGAYPLEDHKLVHRVLGLKKLIAFDLDRSVVARQEFNKPIASCHCVEHNSRDVVDNLDRLLESCEFSDASGIIVWLDYTSPGQLGHQLREFEALLNKASIGDIVRVTVNAHARDLDDRTGLPLTERTQVMERHWQTLKARVGDYLPSGAGPESMTQDALPIVLAQAFERAASKSLPPSGDRVFLPLSIVRYADGQQMLSMTGMVLKRDTEAQVLDILDLREWPFWSDSWVHVHKLVVPDLTLRERLFLEREVVTKTAAELISALGFSHAGEIDLTEFIDNYRNYYRFYPTLLSTDL